MIEFKVSKSTYYRFLNSNPNKDYEDYKLIEKLFTKHKQKIGIRVIKMHLERDYKIIMNHKKIARIKNKYALVTKIRGKNKYKMMHKKKFEHVIFPNILNRKFKQTEADKVYSTDITQINYNGKRAYLAAVKDLCTKEIVGKSISKYMNLHLTNTALKRALNKLSKEKRKDLMIHSDQGYHFTHTSYQNNLKENGVTQSMSRKGTCLDNSPIESFFGHLKDLIELKYCKTFEELEKEVTNKINYYNHRRPQLNINKMTPSEYRKHLELLVKPF